jgi:hypothetical protein
MGYRNNVYAQNWVEQMRTNQERCHPERDMIERMERVDRRCVDVFPWDETYEGYGLWRRRYFKFFSEASELIR